MPFMGGGWALVAPFVGGGGGVSALDTPTLEEACLVLFGKSFGVDTQFVRKENHHH